MKTTLFFAQLACILSIGSADLFLTPQLPAQVLVNDSFNDNSRSKTGANDLNWYSVQSVGTLTMQSDNTTGINEGANDGTLQLAPAGAFLGMSVGNFSSTTLSVGQSFELSLDFRYTVTPANGNVLRFGLYNSNGSPTSADANATSGNDFGYRVDLASSALPSFSKETGANPDVTSGADGTLLTGGTLSSIPAVSTTSHNVAFKLTRSNATTMQFGLLVDGVTRVSSGTYSDNTGAFFTFDEIAFGSGGSGNAFRIDNVKLEVIPEPSTCAILVFGLSALFLNRRRFGR